MGHTLVTLHVMTWDVDEPYLTKILTQLKKLSARGDTNPVSDIIQARIRMIANCCPRCSSCREIPSVSGRNELIWVASFIKIWKRICKLGLIKGVFRLRER